MAETRFQSVVSTTTTGAGDIDKLVASFNKLSDTIDGVSKKSENIKPPKWENFAKSAKDFIQNPLQSAGASAEKLLLQLGPVGGAAIVAGAGIGVLAKVGLDAARSLGTYGVELERTAVRTGLTIKEVGQFSFAMKRSGGDISSLETAMRKLSQGLADGGEEGKKAADALKKMGVATVGLGGDTLPMSQILLGISKGLNAIKDPAERNATAIKIMGRAALESLPDILRFGEGVRRAEQLSKLFATADDVARYQKYHDQIAEIDAVWESLKRNLKEGAVGVISIVAKQVVDSAIAGDTPTGARYAHGFGGLTTEALNAMIRRAAGIPLGMDIAEAQAVASKLAASGTISRDRLMYGRTVAGAEYQAGEAKKKSEDLRTEYFNLESQGDAFTVNKKRKEWQDAEAAATRLTEKLKLLQKEEAKRLVIAERLAELTRGGETAYVIGEGADAVIVTGQQLATANARPIKTPGLFGSGEINPYLAVENAKSALTGPGAADYEQGLQVVNGQMAFVSPSSTRTNPFTAEMLKAYGAGAQEDTKRQQQERLSGIGSVADYRARLAEIRGGPGEEIKIAREVANLRESALKTELDITGDIFHYREASLQNELDLRLKIAEVEERRKQSFQSLAVGFLDAGRSGGGAGLSRFAMGQLNGIEDKFTSNAAGMIWPMIQKSLGGIHAKDPNSFWGKLAQGTPFGADPVKTSTDLNTAATAANTAAIDRYTQAMMGGGAGGASGAGGTFARLGGIGGALPGFSSSGVGTSLYDLPVSNPGTGGGPGGISILSTVPGYSEAAALSKGGGFTATKGIGAAAALGAGAFGIYSGLHAGGASGGLTAAGSALGMVGAVLPLISKSLAAAGPIGMAAGMALGLVTTLLGDPKANREAEIGRHLKYSQYMAPVAINASMTTGGGYADSDRFGGIRGSDLSPFPQVQQGFFDYRHNTTVPGRTVSDFGGGPAPQVVVQVQAIDAKSIIDRHQDIGDAVVRAMSSGHTGLQEAVRNI